MEPQPEAPFGGIAGLLVPWPVVAGCTVGDEFGQQGVPPGLVPLFFGGVLCPVRDLGEPIGVVGGEGPGGCLTAAVLEPGSECPFFLVSGPGGRQLARCRVQGEEGFEVPAARGRYLRLVIDTVRGKAETLLSWILHRR